MRIVRRTLLFVLLGLVGAGAAGALVVATAQSSPVFGVNWHFSVVNKHYLSRVGEFLATGEGVMDFNKEVISGELVTADTSTGSVTVEYQQLKPRARAGEQRNPSPKDDPGGCTTRPEERHR